MAVSITSALRGAATLKQRVQRETRSNASVLPYEKGNSWSPDIWCKEGELLKRTRKGEFRFQNMHPATKIRIEKHKSFELSMAEKAKVQSFVLL